MPDKMTLKVEWSAHSLYKASAIGKYLSESFSDNEVSKFYQLLASFEEKVAAFPKLYEESKFNSIRRAVLNKNLSVYYKIISSRKITIISVLDNRADHSKLA